MRQLRDIAQLIAVKKKSAMQSETFWQSEIMLSGVAKCFAKSTGSFFPAPHILQKGSAPLDSPLFFSDPCQKLLYSKAKNLHKRI